ncbi:MAG TPA: glycosyltransferase family 1 protein, partial [Chloroflexota bacterium]|nr:glycosyltransferase family 1 protein [Chloroflexota bacterium]
TLLVDVARPSLWPLPPVSERVQQVGTAVSPFNLAQQWQIPRLLRQYQADVYHSPYYLMPYHPGVPTILTLYDLIPQLFPAYFSAQRRLLANLTTRLALHRADQVIAISEATRQDVQTQYAIRAQKMTVIPLAPDPRFAPQPAAEMRRVRQQYGLPEAYVLYLGINRPHKNLARLVEAWTAVPTGETILVIGGAWDARYPEIKERVHTLGLGKRIRFIGPVADDDLPALYSGALFFVFPSLYEGFGLPVVEAMACGTAVITSDTSSLPEVAGNAALYVNPEDTADITRQINRFLDNPALVAEYQQKSQTQAQKFTWRDTAVATLNLYRQYASTDNR